MNQQSTDRPLFPSFDLILEATDRLPASVLTEKDSYLASARQQLFGATFASGNLFKSFRGLDLERDIIGQERSAVIAMPDIEPPWLGHFVTDLLVSQILFSRLHSRRRVDNPEVIFVLDEHDDTVSHGAESAFPHGSLSPIARLLRQRNAQKRRNQQRYGELSAKSRELLSLASQHPYWPTARLFECMKEFPTPSLRKSILHQIQEEEYADIVQTRVGQKSLWLIELLPAAWRVLGDPPQALRGRGSWIHCCFANWIRMVGRKRGLKAFCEKPVPGGGECLNSIYEVDRRAALEFWRLLTPELLAKRLECETNYFTRVLFLDHISDLPKRCRRELLDASSMAVLAARLDRDITQSCGW